MRAPAKGLSSRAPVGYQVTPRSTETMACGLASYVTATSARPKACASATFLPVKVPCNDQVAPSLERRVDVVEPVSVTAYQAAPIASVPNVSARTFSSDTVAVIPASAHVLPFV